MLLTNISALILPLYAPILRLSSSFICANPYMVSLLINRENFFCCLFLILELIMTSPKLAISTV